MPRKTDQRSDEAAQYRALYRGAQWQRLREQVMRRDGGVCRMCKRICRTGERSGRTATIDHVIPHKGDPTLFYDIDNLQLLCGACHSGAKQHAEIAGFSRAVDADGYPIDPRHPANVADARIAAVLTRKDDRDA